jgi:phospholipase C
MRKTPPEGLNRSMQSDARRLALSLAAILTGACSNVSAPPPGPLPQGGIHKIQHLVVIMQENRSFDH